jgi:predicted membrane channel-forming protein YqfA (hemolysin III family)
MVKEKSVNVTLQMILVVIPYAWIWGFYRIRKLRKGLVLMFGISIAVAFFGFLVNVSTGNDVREFTNLTFVVYLLSALVGIYFIRKWSIEWNLKHLSTNN